MSVIIGCGLAGLIAANTVFQDAMIFEAQKENELKKHKGILRFRSSKIGDALGIPCKKVTVHKNIYSEGKLYDTCSIRLANLYSQKVLGGKISDRSIWDLKTVERWIAPCDLQERLIERCYSRIYFNSPVDNFKQFENNTIISTMPLHVNCKLANINLDFKFKMFKIMVLEFEIPDCNVYQTIYFPDEFLEFPNYEEKSQIYRASITGNKMIIEAKALTAPSWTQIEIVLKAFGLDVEEILNLQIIEKGFEESTQRKIENINDNVRRALIGKLTDDCNVFSLGRMSIWKNILLDDVMQDIYQIKKMIESDYYSMRLLR